VNRQPSSVLVVSSALDRSLHVVIQILDALLGMLNGQLLLLHHRNVRLRSLRHLELCGSFTVIFTLVLTGGIKSRLFVFRIAKT
jgi:hypothetical protein